MVTLCSQQIKADKQPSSGGVKASDHPTLSQYFKMVKVGVPPQAIKGKMQREGIDPDLLDGPDKIIRKDAFGLHNENELNQDERSSSEEDNY